MRKRADAILDLVDALTVAGHVDSPVALSEETPFRQKFSSIFDTLRHGEFDFDLLLQALSGQGQQLLGAVRSHLGVENILHWVLDIAFREDDCRVRKDQGTQNFAVLRHIALNLLKAEKTSKR